MLVVAPALLIALIAIGLFDGERADEWRVDPVVLLILLSTYASSIAAVAAIPTGSSTLSLMGIGRIIAAASLIYAASLFRSGEPASALVFDAILKGLTVWTVGAALYSFTAFALSSSSHARRIVWCLVLVGSLSGWIAATFLLPNSKLAIALEAAFNK